MSASGYSGRAAPSLFYVDASQQLDINAFLGGNGAAFTNYTGFLTPTGYELDCTVAACAPIATQ
jgi:hypothetical protein